MTSRRRRIVLHEAVATLIVAALGPGRFARAQAAAFVSRPLRMIIAYPPGGAGDIVGQLLGVKLTQILGQPVVIDNRGATVNAPACAR